MKRHENPRFNWSEQLEGVDLTLPSPDYQWVGIPEDLEEYWIHTRDKRFELVGRFLDLGNIEDTDLMTISLLMHKAKYSTPHRFNHPVDSELFPIRNIPKKLKSQVGFPYGVILPLKGRSISIESFEKGMTKIITQTNQDLELIGKPTIPPYISQLFD